MKSQEEKISALEKRIQSQAKRIARLETHLIADKPKPQQKRESRYVPKLKGVKMTKGMIHQRIEEKFRKNKAA